MMVVRYRKHPRFTGEVEETEPPFEAVFSCAEKSPDDGHQRGGSGPRPDLRRVVYRETQLKVSANASPADATCEVLDPGDLVEVLTKPVAGMVHVKTPTGKRGWLHILELDSPTSGPDCETPKPVYRGSIEKLAPVAKELTPSDAVFLQAVTWQAVEVNGKNWFESRSLPPGSVLPAVLEALLALEATGSVAFEVRPKKSLWGGHRTGIWLVPGASGRSWPSGSLEAQLPRRGVLLDGIAEWIGAASSNPYIDKAVAIGFRLEARGLLCERTETERFLKFFRVPVRTWSMPPATASLLQDWRRGPTATGDQAGRSRPTVALITKDIAAAFSKRTTRDYSD